MTHAARAELREHARLLYANPAFTVREVAEKIGVDHSCIHKWAREMSWPRRLENPAVFSVRRAAGPKPVKPRTQQARLNKLESRRLAIVERLYSVIEMALTELERQMSQNDPAHPRDPEREAQVINNMTRAVDKVKDLEPDNAKRNSVPPAAGRARTRVRPTREQEEDVRRRIVEQIGRLRERERNRARSD